MSQSPTESPGLEEGRTGQPAAEVQDRSANSSGRPGPIVRLLRKAASLIAAGLLFGWAYQWAAPRLYRAEVTAGFWLGAAHGAMMPVALPSLLLGQDVPIYAPTNSGRTYKLGYIAGINLCGLVFFGLAFRPGARRSQSR